MQAILMTAAGEAEVLQLRDIDQPVLPSAHHVLVKLVAAGVNPLDAKLRSKPVYFPDCLPAILGCDGAGHIVSIGAQVSRFKVGDPVFFNNGGLGGNQADQAGCYAEYTTLHEQYCAACPVNFSLQDSAALPLILITAWEALVERVHLQAGQTILIHGAAGGVGHIAVQLAHHLGAHILASVSDEKKAQLAQGLDAHKTIAYKQQDFVQATLDYTDGNGADVILDTVGGATFIRSLKAARIGGKVVTLLATLLTSEDVQLARLRNLTLSYELMLTPQVMQLHDERIRQRKILEHCTQLIETGKLGVLISYALPLAEAQQAHRLIEQGGMMGKVILTMD